ncbi:hypothetical protein LC2W_0298 [Lacticaseibacillus paracasei]|nr:hypothetical protein LC2W_0298 [Lacticaseibacillus paracasei]
MVNATKVLTRRFLGWEARRCMFTSEAIHGMASHHDFNTEWLKI